MNRVKSIKLKRYPIYKTVSIGSQILVKFKYTDNKGFRNHFNINETNRIVGFMPDYIGVNPSKVVLNENFLIKFSLRNQERFRDNYSESFYNQFLQSSSETRVVFSRGYNTSHSHLKEFLKDNITSLSVNEILDISLLNSNNWFYTPHVSFYDAKELDFNVRINDKAFPGHYTSKLISRTKEDTNLFSRLVAKRIYQQLKIQPVKNFYLWSVLGREKDVKISHNPEERDVGSRLILATEDSMCTLLMWFAQKIQLSLNTSENKVFNINGEFDAKKFSKLKSYESEYDYKLEADWSFFDSNCDTNFIISACSILLDGLPKDPLHNHIRYLITSSIVTKYVALPPGVVVELNRGVPSGHPFTTLINCTINAIYWSLIGYKIYGPTYNDMMRVEIYGDDTFAYFKYSDKLFEIDTYIDELGLKSAPVREELRLCNFDYRDDELPDFLKRRFNQTSLNWNYKKMFDKFFYQSKKRNLENQIELVNSFYQATPNDRELYRFLSDFKLYLDETVDNEKLQKLLSYKHLEELVKLDDRIEGVKKKFRIEYQNLKNLHLDSKFKEILGLSGVFQKQIFEHKDFKFPKPIQVDLLYFLSFPPDFSVKNKFIYDFSLDENFIRCYNETYFENKDRYIDEMKRKIRNRIGSKNFRKPRVAFGNF
jgi:hypothetical protein